MVYSGKPCVFLPFGTDCLILNSSFTSGKRFDFQLAQSWVGSGGSLDIPSPPSIKQIYEGVSKIFRTDAVKITNLTTKRVWKPHTSTQLRATWHTDSLDMAVLPSTGASCHHTCCINGGTSPEYFRYTLVNGPQPVTLLRIKKLIVKKNMG
jgi:hypothetical protein